MFIERLIESVLVFIILSLITLLGLYCYDAYAKKNEIENFCSKTETITVHIPQSTGLVLIGKALVPRIIPAHAEDRITCIRWKEGYTPAYN